MGFFDTLFGSTESYANPQRRFGEQMPGAMSAYFQDIQAQMQRALAQRQTTKERQFKLFDQMWGNQGMEGGLANIRQMIEDRPSFLKDFEATGRKRLGQEMENIDKRTHAGYTARGMGHTSVPFSKSNRAQAALSANFESNLAQMKAAEAAKKQSDLENINRMQAMMGTERIGKQAALEREYAPYTFDPTSYMGFNLARIGMQPWGMMQQPVEYNNPGILGGQVGNMLGAAGGAAIAGLI